MDNDICQRIAQATVQNCCIDKKQLLSLALPGSCCECQAEQRDICQRIGQPTVQNCCTDKKQLLSIALAGRRCECETEQGYMSVHWSADCTKLLH